MKDLTEVGSNCQDLFSALVEQSFRKTLTAFGLTVPLSGRFSFTARFSCCNTRLKMDLDDGTKTKKRAGSVPTRLRRSKWLAAVTHAPVTTSFLKSISAKTASILLQIRSCKVAGCQAKSPIASMQNFYHRAPTKVKDFN